MPAEDYDNRIKKTQGPVLVFGATGKQGGAVVQSLQAKNWSVRALIRNPNSVAAKALASSGVKVFRGDFSDVASIRAAMAGAYGVFSMQPNSGSPGSGITNYDEVRFGKTVADVAVDSGVEHLVYTSASIISKGMTGLANLDTKIEIEGHVNGLEIASTIVRPSTFMDLLTLPGLGLNQGKFSFFMHPEQAIELIAVEDIGRIVATIFGDISRFARQTLEIAGDLVTGYGVQRSLSAAAGRSIHYQRFSDALLESNPFLGRNAELFDQGRAAGNADIAALNLEFGQFLSLDEWLNGPGKHSLQTALNEELSA